MSRPEGNVAPSLEAAARVLEAFCSGPSPTGRISELEHVVAGMRAGDMGACLQREMVGESLLEAALLLKSATGQIDTVIHAAGILLSLPYVLEPDEVVECVSLGAATSGRGFDLETSRRVAEFKFVNWRGRDANRQRQLFKDLVDLAEHDGSRRRFLYVVGKTYPLSFLNGGTAIRRILNKPEAFYSKYGSRYKVVSDYYHDMKGRVEIVDLREVVPFFEKTRKPALPRF